MWCYFKHCVQTSNFENWIFSELNNMHFTFEYMPFKIADIQSTACAVLHSRYSEYALFEIADIQRMCCLKLQIFRVCTVWNGRYSEYALFAIADIQSMHCLILKIFRVCTVWNCGHVKNLVVQQKLYFCLYDHSFVSNIVVL